MFIDRITELCAKRGISPSYLCDQLGIARSTLSRWREGTAPTITTVNRVADYFGVSTAYLQGIEDASPIPVITTSGELGELIRVYNSLDIKKKTKLLAYAYSLEDGQ